jgi:Carboxypeptidase regulatory-like domain
MPRSCPGMTDSDGRVVITPFPPGPAQLRVTLFNSSYTVRVNVPAGGREMVIAVPDGLIPVKVINRITQHPVEAQLTWVGAGGRVETLTNANGDALMEGVGTSGGTLTVHAREYQTVEGSFDETPDTQQEVALVPSPASRLTVRVVRADAKVPGDAVVELLARGPADVAEFAVTDAQGIATFTDVPPGPLHFSAHADGFAPATVQIDEASRASIVITLTRAR